MRAPVIGTDGIDDLKGGREGLFVFGLGGNDKIHGRTGSDTISGGAGLDRLHGGSGDDRFVFAPGDTGVGVGNRDVILDVQSKDLLDFTAFAAPDRVLTVNVELDGRNDLVQLLVDGVVTAEIKVLTHYNWNWEQFILA